MTCDIILVTISVSTTVEPVIQITVTILKKTYRILLIVDSEEKM